MNPKTKTAAVIGALLAIVTAAPATRRGTAGVDLRGRVSARTRSTSQGTPA